ncbi:MAG: cell division protein FtsQ/DivIB [Lachnospiraceae bacterium]|nr:cell division protein FtsQ/DivIB [Lachnospiraceae bacterium]
MNERRTAKNKAVKILAVMVLLLLLLGGVWWFLTTYTIHTVTAEGSTHYTDEEIEDLVFQTPLDNISLILSWKYRNQNIKNVAFIESIEVTVVGNDSVRIRVYEKSLAGYIEYLGQYVYFDKDGTVVEVSSQVTSGIPLVTGLQFDSVVLEEPLPVENEEVFQYILELTNLISKYELTVDKIYFSSDSKMTLYIGDVLVSLGDSSLLTEKMMKLRDMYPQLDGLSGTLHLENYTSSSSVITFSRN